MYKTISQFEDTIEQISKLKEIDNTQLHDPISDGKWSIREIVGHLYYWDKYNLEKMVPNMTDGANLSQFPDHDEYNGQAILELRNNSIESIINKFIHTRKELIERVKSLGNEISFTIGGDRQQYSAESFIKIFLHHDSHHLKQIHEKLTNY